MTTGEKGEILQIVPMTEPGNVRLASEFKVTALWEQDDLQEFLAYNATRFSALVTTGKEPVKKDLIESLPKLKIIATRGVGYDHVDIAAARQRNVIVTNTPGVLTDCVADLAFGALIAVSRRLAHADRFVRQGNWQKQRFQLTTRVSGKRLGIIGMGRIGQAIARRAAGFSMEVRYHSRKPLIDTSWSYEGSLTTLAEWSDFLIVSTPGGKETRKLVSGLVLEALGAEGFLINVARGSVVDERALLLALKYNQIAGAALDVFENEPLVPEELISMNNVLLLPHVGSSTRETFYEMEEMVIKNLRSFFDTGAGLTAIF